ncbi:hypothetical protein N7517_001146 [Penicillium concentricum]|uniref:FAD-binding domain-containing protein n=1 Tax=Penicillium concentricum TaxID=293559 RepID=A0A9W9SSB9_9EURO|nr:uncharacterized protein N7517_001146 [Penicillium concentricum]KAJ5383235.1 hypothetical protein N7517_001146 [Penicillium concentricum]
MVNDEYLTTDVVICGCDPTGAMLSAYLGHMSTPHIVPTDPRGIALDEDGIRMLQDIGIYDQI